MAATPTPAVFRRLDAPLVKMPVLKCFVKRTAFGKLVDPADLLVGDLAVVFRNARSICPLKAESTIAVRQKVMVCVVPMSEGLAVTIWRICVSDAARSAVDSRQAGVGRSSIDAEHLASALAIFG
jgi:hypothetical protein